MKRFVDRRQHRRYLAEEGAFAAMQPAFSQLGEIENISRGGLAFKYYVPNDRYIRDDISSMNILFNDNLCLSKVRFRIVADFEQDSDLPPPIRTRKCRVQFNGLSRHQFLMLDEFIKTHTTGVVGDRRTPHERRVEPAIRSEPSRISRSYERRIGEERRQRKLKVVTFY